MAGAFKLQKYKKKPRVQGKQREDKKFGNQEVGVFTIQNPQLSGFRTSLSTPVSVLNKRGKGR